MFIFFVIIIAYLLFCLVKLLSIKMGCFFFILI